MLVIADSSPLIALVNINHVDVLPALFGSVTIPPHVADELRSANRPLAIREFIAANPPWLHIRSPKSNTPISPLHAGEAAAINLAMELKADLLLIDDMVGRKAAVQRSIRLTGTIGVLELAATAKLLDLKEAFEKTKRTDFWIAPALLDERLRRFDQSQPC